jgi:hypothetical protein
VLDVRTARLRANTQLTLIPFDRMSGDERKRFGDTLTGSAFSGILRDESGGAKLVDADSAQLFERLQGADEIPPELEIDGPSVARLVLDGMLEVETAEGFVSGPRALDVVVPPPPARDQSGEATGARLSVAALRYAQQLQATDPAGLSAQMYFYNRLPLSPAWFARLPSRDAVARFLGVDRGGSLTPMLRGSWRRVRTGTQNDGWLMWTSRDAPAAPHGHGRFKLYVSPMPDAVPDALAASIAVAHDVGAFALKVGCEVTGLLRPDKIVVYLDEDDQVDSAAARLSLRLAGAVGHGVPFTADAGSGEGLLSWGVDPPASEQAFSWQQKESWRLWLTNQLAVAVIAAQRSGTTREPWEYALARLELEGVDTETWTPKQALWR